MSRRQERLPIQIDPFRLAEAGRLLEGALALKQMKRLCSALADTEGDIKLALEFGIDNMGVSFLKGQIRAELSLECQRCLGDMNWSVDTGLALGFVRSQAKAESMIGPYEPYIVDSLPVDLRDLIEDEILLSLPQIAMHPFDECPGKDRIGRGANANGIDTGTQQNTKQDEVGRDNPFHVLAALKTSDSDKEK